MNRRPPGSLPLRSPEGPGRFPGNRWTGRSGRPAHTTGTRWDDPLSPGHHPPLVPAKPKHLWPGVGAGETESGFPGRAYCEPDRVHSVPDLASVRPLGRWAPAGHPDVSKLGRLRNLQRGRRTTRPGTIQSQQLPAEGGCSSLPTWDRTQSPQMSTFLHPPTLVF